MEFFDVLKEKQVDIYISLFMTILGLLLGIVIDSLRKSTPTSGNHALIIPVTVTSIISSRGNHFNNHSSDDGLKFFIGLFLLVAGTIYLFFRAEILNLIYYLTVFIISLWAGRITYSFYISRFIGWQWIVNLTFYCVFFVVSFLTVNKALVPNFSPDYFNNSQKIINQHGLVGLKDYFTLQDFKWFVLHLLGVMMLFIAMLRMLLSSTYFAVMGNYVLNEEEQEPWLAKKTRKYAYFKKNIVLVSCLIVTSYYFVAGNFFMWLEYDFPKQVEYLFNIALYGR